MPVMQKRRLHASHNYVHAVKKIQLLYYNMQPFSPSLLSQFTYIYLVGRSPVRYQDLEIGEYRVQVLPVGCDSQGKKLSTKFNIY